LKLEIAILHVRVQKKVIYKKSNFFGYILEPMHFNCDSNSISQIFFRWKVLRLSLENNPQYKKEYLSIYQVSNKCTYFLTIQRYNIMLPEFFGRLTLIYSYVLIS